MGFTVHVFNAKEDTGVVEGTYALTYKIDSGKQAWVYEENLSSWSPIPMGRTLKHKQLGDYVAVNQCYKLKRVVSSMIRAIMHRPWNGIIKEIRRRL